MFDFGMANRNQREAIAAVDGPVLIIAGPGTGKTYTLVQRAIYLIEERRVKPEEIMMVTFTDKAAKELLTRITDELDKRHIQVNVNAMYVGTFHSICLRIIKEHLDHTRLRRNFRTLDAFDQQYVVYRNIGRFREIKDVDLIKAGGWGGWNMAENICRYCNILTEEMVDIHAMASDSSPALAALAEVAICYQELLREENLLDFSSMQAECHRLLTENVEILEALRKQIRYIMVDEYQDTNYIQEQIVFLLGDHQNICVVGDDDQGLYRFRGATIRNILEFPGKFPKGRCRIVHLVDNYRSEKDIIDFYNKWMRTTTGPSFGFSWDRFRYEKSIRPARESTLEGPSVARLGSHNGQRAWREKVLGFIRNLKASGKLTDYNQIAFLFRSVKNDDAVALAKFLEQNGIDVYSPRSNMFFQRKEIRQILGCLMRMFPDYLEGLERRSFLYESVVPKEYYRDCIQESEELTKQRGNRELADFIRNHAEAHRILGEQGGAEDYGYTGLLYRLFGFEPFRSILDTNLTAGLADVRATRNLALFTRLIGKYEYLHRLEVLTGKNIGDKTERLFNQYLRLLVREGITEYEDDEEYAPSGCVSFLTIHQAKGMEFPIVIVDSLFGKPYGNENRLLAEVEEKYYHRPHFEPSGDMRFFDFWRLYYTAFSRAQDMMVLACDEKPGWAPSDYFSEVYWSLPDISEVRLEEFDFHTVRKVHLKNTYSFTSHIAVYDTCSLQYKFFKELEFSPSRKGALIFGSLVHETLEDVHKAVLRGEKPGRENIEGWFRENYASMLQAGDGHLAAPQQKAALRQVLRYVGRQGDDWSSVREAEVDVSLAQPDYIIGGKVDLVRSRDGALELVDFKSEKKPDETGQERLEHYRKQLELYAYLVERQTGEKVSRMHLYYTGEEQGNPVISFPFDKTGVEATVAAFDDTVRRILKKDFSRGADSRKTCGNCDFRFYCDKAGPDTPEGLSGTEAQKEPKPAAGHEERKSSQAPEAPKESGERNEPKRTRERKGPNPEQLPKAPKEPVREAQKEEGSEEDALSRFLAWVKKDILS